MYNNTSDMSLLGCWWFVIRPSLGILMAVERAEEHARVKTIDYIVVACFIHFGLGFFFSPLRLIFNDGVDIYTTPKKKKKKKIGLLYMLAWPLSFRDDVSGRAPVNNWCCSSSASSLKEAAAAQMWTGRYKKKTTQSVVYIPWTTAACSAQQTAYSFEK